MSSRKAFVMLSAAFGGISPNLFRLAMQLTQGEAELPGISYLLGLLIFAAMGAAVALIWGETDFKKAFYLGIGLPAFIQMSTVQTQVDSTSAIESEAQAYYQTAPAQQVYAPGAGVLQAVFSPQEKWLVITMKNYQPRYSGYTVLFYGREGKLLGSEEKRVTRDNLSARFAPAKEAAAFRIRIRSSLSRTVELGEQREAFEISVSTGFWGGFWEALGFGRDESLEIHVTPAGDG